MDRRFACTACGKCCHGQLPLTIKDALAHADKFPLVVAWTPVRQGGRSFQATADLGITIELKKKRKAAVRIAPTADLPPSFPCPALAPDGLCAMHDNKPQRCRTMPLSAYRDESDQDDLLIPRPGWECDTSDDAPIFSQDGAVVERGEFAAERGQLERDARILEPYGQWMLDASPKLGADLLKLAMKPGGGQVMVAFSTLVPRMPKVDIFELAEKQAPLARALAERTAGDPGLSDFHRRYVESAKEWERTTRAQQ